MTEITSENFNEYFFDIRRHKPQKGQVIACFRAICQLINNEEKRFLIQLLQRPDSARSITTMMTKVFNASKHSSWSLPIEMGNDLLGGMSVDEVAKKEYEFEGEFYYYTMPDYIPKDDPHWEIVKIVDVSDYIQSEQCTPIKFEES
jgi:hypothetical protein